MPSGGRFFGVGLEHNSDDIDERWPYPFFLGRIGVSRCFRLLRISGGLFCWNLGKRNTHHSWGGCF